MVIPRDGVFYPSLTQILDSFSCAPLSTAFWKQKWAVKLLIEFSFQILVLEIFSPVKNL